MAENKYENQFCFVDSSTIINNYLINYHCNIYCIFYEKHKTIYSYVNWDSVLYQSGSWSCLFTIRIEIVHTANGTAIISTIWDNYSS